jgi:hypothetical protein
MSAAPAEYNPQWINIDPDQAELFIKPVGAAGELLFNGFSSQVGVGLHNGITQPFTLGDEQYDSAAWPDEAAHQTADVLFLHRSRRPWHPSGFVIVENAPGEPYEPERAAAYHIEGVALNVGNPAVNYYGNVIMPKANVSDDGRVKAAANFLGMAILRARSTPRPVAGSLDSRMGLDNVRAERITASLASLWQNLAFKGRLSEQLHRVTRRAFKVAGGLLDTYVDDGLKGRLPGNIPLVGKESDEQLGVAFNDKDGNLTAIRYISTFVPTFIFTTVRRPANSNDAASIEQYFIQARGAFVNISELPAQQYTLRGMIGKFPELDKALVGNLSERAILGDSGIDLLVDKMSALQGNRNHQSA